MSRSVWQARVKAGKDALMIGWGVKIAPASGWKLAPQQGWRIDVLAEPLDMPRRSCFPASICLSGPVKADAPPAGAVRTLAGSGLSIHVHEPT